MSGREMWRGELIKSEYVLYISLSVKPLANSSRIYIVRQTEAIQTPIFFYINIPTD